ncbi:MAG: type II toxin-antitoxin system Phd/YefM family antitoxin [Terriglobales bacterium]
MTKVTASAARKDLYHLLDLMEKGETFEIARRGKAIAWLEPWRETEGSASPAPADAGRNS